MTDFSPNSDNTPSESSPFKVATKLTDGKQHRIPPVTPHVYTMPLTAIERSQHNGRPIWKLFGSVSGFLPFWFPIDDPVIVAAVDALPEIDRDALKTPQVRRDIAWSVELHKDGKYQKAISVKSLVKEPVEDLISYFDKMPRTVIAVSIEIEYGVDWLVTLDDGETIAFPPEDSVLNVQTSHLPKSEQKALQDGAIIPVHWQLEYRTWEELGRPCIEATRVALMTENGPFKGSGVSLDELHDKGDNDMGNGPAAQTAADASDLGPMFASFNELCKVNNVPENKTVRDRIRHEATGYSSWRGLPVGIQPGDLMTKTRAFVLAGSWKSWPADGVPETPPVSELDKVLDRKPDGTPNDNPTPHIGDDSAEAPERKPENKPAEASKTVATGKDSVPDTSKQEPRQSGTEKPIVAPIVCGESPCVVYPMANGSIIYKGIRFSVTLRQPGGTFAMAIPLMEEFVQHIDWVDPSCRVNGQTTMREVPQQPSAPALPTLPMAGAPSVPAAATAPNGTPDGKGRVPGQTGTDQIAYIQRSSVNGAETIDLWTSSGQYAEHHLRRDNDKALVAALGINAAGMEVGVKYPCKIAAQWVVTSNKNTKGTYFRDVTSLQKLAA